LQYSFKSEVGLLGASMIAPGGWVALTCLRDARAASSVC